MCYVEELSEIPQSDICNRDSELHRRKVLKFLCVELHNAVDAGETRQRQLWGAHVRLPRGYTRRCIISKLTGPLPCACSQSLQGEAGGGLAFVLSRATNLLNILFWLKINSCFWPIWINFTFSKYLLNWQTTIRWKNQLNRAKYSLPLSASLPAPSSLSTLACLSVLIHYFHTRAWDKLLGRHTGTKVAGVLDVGAGLVDRGMGKGWKDKRSTSMASKDWQVQFLSINDTAKLIGHRRPFNVLLYQFGKTPW